MAPKKHPYKLERIGVLDTKKPSIWRWAALKAEETWLVQLLSLGGAKYSLKLALFWKSTKLTSFPLYCHITIASYASSFLLSSNLLQLNINLKNPSWFCVVFVFFCGKQSSQVNTQRTNLCRIRATRGIRMRVVSGVMLCDELRWIDASLSSGWNRSSFLWEISELLSSQPPSVRKNKLLLHILCM